MTILRYVLVRSLNRYLLKTHHCFPKYEHSGIDSSPHTNLFLASVRLETAMINKKHSACILAF